MEWNKRRKWPKKVLVEIWLSLWVWHGENVNQLSNDFIHWKLRFEYYYYYYYLYLLTTWENMAFFLSILWIWQSTNGHTELSITLDLKEECELFIFVLFIVFSFYIVVLQMAPVRPFICPPSNYFVFLLFFFSNVQIDDFGPIIIMNTNEVSGDLFLILMFGSFQIYSFVLLFSLRFEWEKREEMTVYKLYSGRLQQNIYPVVGLSMRIELKWTEWAFQRGTNATQQRIEKEKMIKKNARSQKCEREEEWCLPKIIIKYFIDARSVMTETK